MLSTPLVSSSWELLAFKASDVLLHTDSAAAAAAAVRPPLTLAAHSKEDHTELQPPLQERAGAAFRGRCWLCGMPSLSPLPEEP